MQAIKQSVLLRPISRSSSPAPASNTPGAVLKPDPNASINDATNTHPLTRPASRGALNRFGLSSFRGRTPVLPSSVNNVNGSTLIQDGSYLESLALKVSEAVSRALMAPTSLSNAYLPDDSFNGRKALPQGRGTAFMTLIETELNASKDNPQLSKAILRLLHRPMSVMLTNLNALLLPVLLSPTFQSADIGFSPTAAQLQALSYATFASEILAGFDQLCLGLVPIADNRGDSLQGVREGLVSVVTRVLNPIISAIKQDLLPILSGLEATTTEFWTPSNKLAVSLKSNPVGQSYHPNINLLHSRVLAHSKILIKCAGVGGKVCDSLLAGLHISLVWRSLVALGHRKFTSAPAASPPTSSSSSMSFKKRITPPSTPRVITFKTGSRPPSPAITKPPTPAADARGVHDLLGSIPKPSNSNADATEAVDEAYDDLYALAVLYDTLDTYSGQIDDHDLDVLTDELPTLIAIPVLLNSPKVNTGALSISVSMHLDMEEHEYRQTCLASFGREEECAETVVKKLIEVLASDGTQDSTFMRWLKGQME